MIVSLIKRKINLKNLLATSCHSTWVIFVKTILLSPMFAIICCILWRISKYGTMYLNFICIRKKRKKYNSLGDIMKKPYIYILHSELPKKRGEEVGNKIKETKRVCYT